jgi:hypothetical protein
MLQGVLVAHRVLSQPVQLNRIADSSSCPQLISDIIRQHWNELCVPAKQ